MGISRGRSVIRPRTVVGSAVPLLLLVGLIALAPAQAAPAPAVPSAPPPPDDEQRALLVLRRAVDAASALPFTGTQLVTAWHGESATTRLVEIRQWPGGRRLVSVRGSVDPTGADAGAAAAAGGTSQAGGAGASSGSAAASGSATMAASTVSDMSVRGLDAMAAAYQVRSAGVGRAAGRSAVVVQVRREGRDAARLWLDRQTGLPLRQDVYDGQGHLRRMAAFIDVQLAVPAGAAPVAPEVVDKAAPGQSAAVLMRGIPAEDAAPSGWQALPPERATRWCDRATCPAELPGGFRLLGARRGAIDGRDVVHVVYGDGLSAISVFLQPGRLDTERLQGMAPLEWGETEVFVGQGWPARLTWQGGSQVFTVVSDAAGEDLRLACAALPHGGEMADTGNFTAFRRGVRSVLGWLLDE